MIEAFSDDELYRNGKFYKFYYDTNSSEIKFSTYSSYKIDAIDKIYDYYAWYDLGNWFTEDKRIDDYLKPDNSYSWIRSNTN